METILKRRSVRKFIKKTVSTDIVRDVLKAGMNAPSAGNQKPWQFIVVDKREMLDGLMKAHPYAAMLADVNVAIVICGDLSLEKHKDYWVQDCSAATENMLLEVADKGLGSVWLGVYPREDRVNGIKKLFRLPENIIPLSVIPIGYPAENIPPNDSFDESRVHMNLWNKR